MTKKIDKLEFYGHWLKLLLTFFVTENVYSEPQSVKPGEGIIPRHAGSGTQSWGFWGRSEPPNRVRGGAAKAQVTNKEGMTKIIWSLSTSEFKALI